MCMRANDATGRTAIIRSDRGSIVVLGVLGRGRNKEGNEERNRETVKGEGKERNEMKRVRLPCRDPKSLYKSGQCPPPCEHGPDTFFTSAKRPLGSGGQHGNRTIRSLEWHYQSAVFLRVILVLEIMDRRSKWPKSLRVSRTKQ